MTDAVEVALIVTAGTVVSALLTNRNARKIDAVDKKVDGRMTEMLDLIRQGYRADREK